MKYNLEAINKSAVPDQYRDFRLDRYLAERFTYLSRTGWQNEIRDGRILYNGEVMLNYHKRVKIGDSVTYQGRGITEPEVDRNYTILYEDEHIMVINKPGNLPVHPAGIYFHHTLLNILREDFNADFHPVHRLDRETSGVILFAKDPRTTTLIHDQFHKNVRKEYLAIVKGLMPGGDLTLDAPLGQDTSSAIRKKRAAYKGAPEQALTVARPLLHFGDYTLVKALPVTGRLHQIRIHLDYAGYPIVGDKLYGAPDSVYLDFIAHGYTDELIRFLTLKRCALHSRSILFYHPWLKKTIYIKAPLPHDLREFIVSHREEKNNGSRILTDGHGLN